MQILQGIRQIEDRFLAQSDKDLLLMIVDSMIKGQKVSVKKVHEYQSKVALNELK